MIVLTCTKYPPPPSSRRTPPPSPTHTQPYQTQRRQRKWKKNKEVHSADACALFTTQSFRKQWPVDVRWWREEWAVLILNPRRPFDRTIIPREIPRDEDRVISEQIYLIRIKEGVVSIICCPPPPPAHPLNIDSIFQLGLSHWKRETKTGGKY